MTRRRSLVLGGSLLVLLIGAGGLGAIHQAGARPAILTVAISQGFGQLILDGATGRAFIPGMWGLDVLDLQTGAHMSGYRTPGGFMSTLVPTELVPAERTGRAFALVQRLPGIAATQVVALDGTTGQPLRTLTVPRGTAATQIVVDAPRGDVYVPLAPVPGHGLQILVLDATTGQPRRMLVVQTTSAVAPPTQGRYALNVDPVTARLYITEGDDGVLQRIDRMTGRMLWRVRLGTPPAIPDNNPTIRPPLITSTGRLVVFNYRTGDIAVLDGRTGRRVRSLRVPAGGVNLLACQQTRRVFVFHGAAVDVLDATSGQRLGVAAIGASYATPAAVDEHDRRILLLDNIRSSMIVLDAVTGQVVRTVPVGGSFPSLAVDELRGRVYVATTGPPGLLVTTGREGNGRVRVLDVRTGALLRTVSVGRLPDRIAVDAQSGRVAVVNINGSDFGPDPWGWIPQVLRTRLPFLPAAGPRSAPSSVTMFNAVP